MGELGTRARELKEKRKKVESGIAEFANERLSAKNAREFCRYAQIPLGQEKAKPVCVGAIAAQWKKWLEWGLQEEEESEEEDEEEEEEEEEVVVEREGRKEKGARRLEGTSHNIIPF